MGIKLFNSTIKLIQQRQSKALQLAKCIIKDVNLADPRCIREWILEWNEFYLRLNFIHNWINKYHDQNKILQNLFEQNGLLGWTKNNEFYQTIPYIRLMLIRMIHNNISDFFSASKSSWACKSGYLVKKIFHYWKRERMTEGK